MIENTKTSMDKLVENSELPLNEKNLLQELFHGLSSAQANLFTDISKSVMKEIKTPCGSSSHFKVVTGLSDSNLEEIFVEKGLFPMIFPQYQEEGLLTSIFPAKEVSSVPLQKTDNDKIYLGFGFLHCSYEELGAFFQKDFVATFIGHKGEEKITFSLHKSLDFSQKEQVLFQISRQNHLERPVIYSPMSRRAVDIYVNLPDEFEKDGTIDLDLKGNNLENILLLDKLLYWNIEMKHSSELPSLQEKFVTSFEEKMKTYQLNVEENEFIYFPDFTQVVKRAGTKIYIPMSEDHCTENLEYYKVKCLATPSVGNMEKFENFWDRDIFHKERIISLSDIPFAIHEFDKMGLNFLKVQENIQNTSPIIHYDRDDAYVYQKDSLLKRPQFLYLVFKQSNDIYFADKISYIVSFMNHHYPEFRFVGVTR